MSKNTACELCGLPDNSYTIEDAGKVFKVCKLCHDGFVEKQGADPSASPDIIEQLIDEMDMPSAPDSKVETLSPEQMAKLLTPTSDERKKLYASLRKAAAQKGDQKGISADTEDLKRELLQVKEEIEAEKRLKAEMEEEKRQRVMVENVKNVASELEDAVNSDSIDSSVEEAMKKLMVKSKSPSEKEQEQLDIDIKAKRAEEKRIAAQEKALKAANPTIDDERIKITGPEVELEKDRRPKTNFDVATKEHVGAVRFIEAFKYVMHPVVYAVFAGIVTLAVATVLMIIMSWKEAVINFFAGAGAVALGFLFVWYLKRKFETDRRTYLLRIRQEQIAFDSMTTSCYRELKTKYPIIRGAGWLMSRLAVIIPVVIIIGGTVAAVIATFLSIWWIFAPVALCATVGAVLVYYVLKFVADFISYKLDIERNQQIMQQSLLDLLSQKKGK